MIAQILFITKLVAYVWALVEVSTLAHLYFYAYRAGSRSRVIKYLFILLTAIAFNIAYRLVLNYTVNLRPEYHRVFKHGVIIPLILIILTSRGFRKVSLDTNIKKIHKDIKEM